MSSAVVVVFFLDNLSGIHNNINESIHINLPSQTNITIQQCDSTMTEDIINAMSEQLGLHIVRAWGYNEQKSSDAIRETAPESLQNKGTTFDNSFEPDNSRGSFDRDTNLINDTYKLDDSDCSGDIVAKDADDGVIKNGSKVEFPKIAPFLVAIFESLLNVTAQTCAGSLVSPRWVLTAASCVNLLANLYGNDTSFNPSHYTIVAGSINPLSDGTVHNVTSVLLHPNAAVDNTDTAQDRTKGPLIALMRIEPEIVRGTVAMVGGEVNDTDVMVYGWVLSKNDSGHDTLRFTSMSATVLSTAECKAMYSYRKNDVLCLFNNEFQKNITLLSTGGPVLAVHKNQVKMLAVAQTDEHLFVAYSLTAHLKWIKTILSDKS